MARGQIGPIMLIIPGMGGKLPIDQAAAIQSLIRSNTFLVGVREAVKKKKKL